MILKLLEVLASRAKNRRSLAKHEAFERMLRGREVEGWPKLEEAEVGV